jgi:UDP-N-acetylmuramoyl-tripeptide--D-alanyl-D-alanine ligase
MHDMMTLDQAQQWLAGSQRVGLGSVRFARVHTDTRTLAPGDLFVALRGERFDANDFLAEAKAQGAVAAICQGDAQARLQAAGLPGLVVADAKAALASLATQWRQQFKLPLIAVTGSNGKTTVTQMIAAILRAYKPQAYLATQGNLNNDIGVPLTLLRLRAHHEVAVLELGMNHPGEIAALAAMAQPTVALVNNAQREHLEFMATVQAVAEENGSVLDALPADGVAIFPANDAYSALWASMAEHCRTLQFSTVAISQHQDQDQDQTPAPALNQNQVYCEKATWSGDAWQVTAHTPAGRLSYALHIAGRHNVSNSLAAVASSCAAGVPLAAIAQGLSAFEPVKGRSRAVLVRHAGRLLTLVDDTYNANPDSVRAALDVLADLPGPRLLVLGDMGEVGEQGPVFHAEAGALARSLGIEQVFTLGVLSRATSQSFGDGQHFDTLDALQAAVLTALPHCASVLVKGARFMQMERVVQAITAPATPTLKETHAV